MSKPKFYKWTVEFEVESVWVADGFVLTDDRALQMLATDLGYANGYELKARVIKSPNLDAIAKEQGYRDSADMLIKNPSLREDLHA